MSKVFAAASFVSLLGWPALASCGSGLRWISPRKMGFVAVPNFNYGTLTGPENWHHIETSYGTCANGTMQSPILISSANTTVVPCGSINLNVPTACDVTFENLGTNVEVVINGTLQANNETWILSQFHFHTPSEHRVDLDHFESEMHFVFSAADGSKRAAVLGYFIEVQKDESTEVLETIFSHLDEIQTPGTTTTVPKINMWAFEQAANAQSYYYYTGSLTTPPCTEGVAWYIATQPIPLSLDTYAALKNTTKTKNRFTQRYDGVTRSQNILEPQRLASRRVRVWKLGGLKRARGGGVESPF